MIPTSLEEEIKEIHQSGSSKALDNTSEFEPSDIFYFCRKGMETIMNDEVTKRFSAEELESWNLLSRTNYNVQYIRLRLKVLWGLGVLTQYCFLLPLSIALAFIGISLLVVGTTVVGCLSNGKFTEFMSKHVHLVFYQICVRTLTAIITYHDRENRLRNGGIHVASHTLPIDVIILTNDGYYAMVGQVHRDSWV
ncbi:Glycerol-3-phosphate acyltransferase 4 [Plecturocebus cupreus]